MSRSGAYHVLIVSDDDGLRLLLKRELASPRCRVSQAASLDALDGLFRPDSVHVLLVDSLVDDAATRRTLNRLAPRLREAGTAVIVIVRSAAPDELRALTIVDDVIPAPFSADTLVSTVRRHVVRASRQQESHTRMRAAPGEPPASDEDAADGS